MNVFHKVTRESLRKNRLRTIVTIVGVLLSAAMVCAVTTIVVSFQGFYRDSEVYETGDWYGRVERADQEVRQALEADSRVAHVASAEILGYSASESQNEDKPYIYLLGADATFFDVMPVRAVGRLPEQEGEILVPSHYLSVGNGGASLQIGDTVELALGERMVEGCPLNQSNPLCDEEALQIRETRTYRVVGFYERPDFEDYSAPGYTFLTVPESGGPQNYMLYYKTADAGDMNAVIAAHDLPEDQNWNLLAAEGVFRYDNFGRMFFGLATILIFLIVLGSVSLIYSAFSISVSERTRQFGLLRSVGATRSQLRRSVLYEAAVISVIGIPLGILCGLGGMAVTLHFIGGLFQGVLSAEIPMRFRVSWGSVGGSAIIALVTVLISVWIPASRATRVTALEAIRQNQDIRIRGKDVRVSRLTGRLFGLEGILAKKYFRRNRRRYRATIVSLVLSLVLFISASSFCMYLTGTVDETLSVSNYDVLCFLDGKSDPKAVFSALSEAKGVQQGAYWKEDRGYLLLEQSQLDETYLRYGEAAAKTFWQAYADPSYTDAVVIPVEQYYVDEASYRQFLTAQGLDADRYLDASHPLPLVYNEGSDVIYLQGAGGHYERQVYPYQILKHGTKTAALRQPQAVEGYDYGYTGNVSDSQPDVAPTPAQDFFFNEEGEEISRPTQTAAIELGATVQELPLGVSTREGGGCILIYPYVCAPDDGREISACFTSSSHAETAESLEEILLERGSYTGSGQVYDVREQESSSRNMVTIVNVFSYGFIVLISLIAVANVFNTISTNVALRRREFAMLRSVGMTRGGMNRMMNYECLLYGFRALAFGLPLSALMTLFIYDTVGNSVSSTFQVPWSAAAVAVCSIFVVVFATMLYAMGRIKRENPIDALKNENT